jgi:hypothetical protein
MCITARQTRLSPPASERAGCQGSRRQGTPHGSSPPLVPWPSTSTRGAIGSPPPRIVTRWPNESRAGRRSQARRWPRQGRAPYSPPTSTAGDGIGTHKLTMPAALMAVLFAHAKRLEQVRTRLAAIRTEKDLPAGNPPQCRAITSLRTERSPRWLLRPLN